MASRFEDDEPAGMPPAEFPPEATSERPKVVPIKKPLEGPRIGPLDWPSLAGHTPPERSWAIRGWFGFGHTTLMVGSGGIGKTLLAQEIGSALSLGEYFIGEVERPFKVLMWACEDDHDELWRRQVNIAAHFKRGIGEFENFVLIPRHGQDNALCSSEFGKITFTPRIAELQEQAGDHKADIVILDNVAQLYGAGENDRHAVTAFLNNLSGALGHRAIMLLAHPSRSQGSEFSGSGAWENVARTRLYLGSHLPDQKPDPDQEVNHDERYLCRRKANYSSKDWRRFTYEFGVLIPETIENNSDGGIVAVLREKAAERLVLEAIPKLQAMGIFGNESNRSPQYLPNLILQYKLGYGQTKPDIASAMRSLMTAGRIVKKPIGKNANRTDRIGFVVAETL